MAPGAVIAMDIGGGHVTAGVVDGSLVLATVRRPTAPNAPAEELLAGWAGAAVDAWLGAGEPTGWLLGEQAPGEPPSGGPSALVASVHAASAGAPFAVVVAMPAPFDYGRGVSRMVHKFASLRGVDVGAALAARWVGSALEGVPVVFANDADLWTLGEAWAGEGRGAARVIGLTLGTGLGSGFVADGRVVRAGDGVPADAELWCVAFDSGAAGRDAGGAGGEVGVAGRDAGGAGGDGGIAEDRASGRAVAEGYERLTGVSLGAVAIADAARAGDRSALRVFRQLGSDLSVIVAPWVRSFGADVLVVGGNVARAFDLFGPTLRDGIAGEGAHPAEKPPSVRCTTLFETATLLGAGVLGRNHTAGAGGRLPVGPQAG